MTRIALALGAGGARGLAHIHALAAFDDLGIKPVVISGTSIGALIGAAYCAGMSAAEIKKFVQESFENRAGLMGKALKIRPASFSSFLADGGLRLGELNLETILSVFLPEDIPEKFEELSIPLLVVATDFYAETGGVFRAGPLRKAITASAAMPAVFLPVTIDGKFYIDGNATDPCPLDLVQEYSAKVIAIDVSGGPRQSPDTRPSKIDAIYASSQIMQQSLVKQMAKEFPQTVLLRPPVEQYRPLDFLKASEILAETAGLRDQVKVAITDFLDKADG